MAACKQAQAQTQAKAAQPGKFVVFFFFCVPLRSPGFQVWAG